MTNPTMLKSHLVRISREVFSRQVLGARAGHTSMVIVGREGNKGQGNWSLEADFRALEVPETEALARQLPNPAIV